MSKKEFKELKEKLRGNKKEIKRHITMGVNEDIKLSDKQLIELVHLQYEV